MIQLHQRHQSIGCFLPVEDNLTGHIINALDYGLYSFSFSLGHNRNYKRTRIEDDDLYTTLGILTRFPMIVFSILPKMYNLCGHKNVLAWNGNIEQNQHTSLVIEEIAYELYILSKIKGSVIIEAGFFREKTIGIDTCIQSIHKIPFKPDYRLVLMNSLDTHHSIATTIEDLHTIYNRLDARVKPNIFMGIHFAYLFANGSYDTRYPSEIRRFFHDIDTNFPPFIFNVIHLTDTKTSFSSKEYIECDIGTGEMWTNSESLEELLRHCSARYITVMTSDVRNVETIRTITRQIHS